MARVPDPATPGGPDPIAGVDDDEQIDAALDDDEPVDADLFDEDLFDDEDGVLFDDDFDDFDDEFDDDDPDEDPGEGESPFRDRPFIPTERALALLAEGTIEIIGRMPWSSNATFLVDLEHDGLLAQGIYKPARGERPLWDFPSGLYRREVAAFTLSEHLGWGLVPPTVERDGPLGPGSLQLFVPADFTQHYFTIRDAGRHTEVLQQLCVFDIVTNNTDRKGGHVLLDRDDRIWAIDNGLSFHAEFKLRTVIWDFAGAPVPRPVLDTLAGLLDTGLPDAVAEVLTPFERDAALTRCRAVLVEGRFPVDHTGRRYPWPLV
jgi:uncharacterized repeat protein (TIGR03843 family)